MDNVAAAQRLARPTAPSVNAMVAWYLVAIVGPNLLLEVLELAALPKPWALGIGLAVTASALVLCHRAYRRARRELAADPGLRGSWFVENAWWVLLVPFAMVTVGMAVVVFFLARGLAG